MDEKPIVDEKPGIITVKLLGNDNSVVEIRARPTTKIDKLLSAYASQKNVDPKNFKIMDSEGRQVRGGMTLQDAAVEDGDSLSVVMDQVGGR